MELNKCSRCGAFHTNSGDVCPKCANIDNLELSTFKRYIASNGFSSIDTIATETGITQKNVNRFLGYEAIDNLEISAKESFNETGIIFN